MGQSAPPDVTAALQHNLQHWSLREKAQEHLLQATGPGAAAAIQAALQPPQHSNLIRTASYALRHDLPIDSPCGNSGNHGKQQEAQRDPQLADTLAALQRDWQALVLQRLAAAQQLLSPTPLVATASSSNNATNSSLRAGAGDVDGLDAWERVGASRTPLFAASTDLPVLRKLLYDASDLLAALTGGLKRAPAEQAAGTQQQKVLPTTAASPAAAAAGPAPGPQLLEQLPAPEWPWLQSFFGELRADQRQTGLDDVLHPWYAEQQLQQVQLILSSASAAAARGAARTGLPPALRPGIWAGALGIQTVTADSCSSCIPCRPEGDSSEAAGSSKLSTLQQQQQQSGGCLLQPTSRDAGVLQLLCEAMEGQQLLVDALTCADVQRIADSPQYFVFEDTLRAVLLAFSRDPSISSSCAAQPHPCVGFTAAGAGAAPSSPGAIYPPSGVLPYQGLATFAAPLCYVYEHPALVYRLFVAMYCRYWCRLTSWGGAGVGEGPAAAASLPGLCKAFLHVLQDKDPAVARHLSTLRYPPLQVALPWMVSAFVGHLSPGEVLALWDRVVGYDSLLVLPLLAAAVLIFRRDLILAAESGEELVEVMEDLSSLRVVPLLQALLFDS